MDGSIKERKSEEWIMILGKAKICKLGMREEFNAFVDLKYCQRRIMRYIFFLEQEI